MQLAGVGAHPTNYFTVKAVLQDRDELVPGARSHLYRPVGASLHLQMREYGQRQRVYTQSTHTATVVTMKAVLHTRTQALPQRALSSGHWRASLPIAWSCPARVACLREPLVESANSLTRACFSQPTRVDFQISQPVMPTLRFLSALSSYTC